MTEDYEALVREASRILDEVREAPSERMVVEATFVALEDVPPIRPSPDNVAHILVESGWASDLADALGRVWDAVLDPEELVEVFLDEDDEWRLWLHAGEVERLWRRHDFGKVLRRLIGEERVKRADYQPEDVIAAWQEVFTS